MSCRRTYEPPRSRLYGLGSEEADAPEPDIIYENMGKGLQSHALHVTWCFKSLRPEQSKGQDLNGGTFCEAAGSGGCLVGSTAASVLT